MELLRKMMIKIHFNHLLLLILIGVISIQSIAQENDESLTIYSARREELVAPIIEQFTEDTGITVEVRYGNLAEMVAMILEEGANSPADVFFAQDASGLGALAKSERLIPLSDDILELVPEHFRSADGLWVGTSGRARVLIYNPTLIAADELPASLLDLTDEQWRGMVGWSPTNGPFQGQITAIRVLLGEDVAQEWLEGMVANDTVTYPENTAVVQAVINGEVAMGLVNHYYLNEFRAEDPDIEAENHYFEAGDVGALVNVAAAGILDSSDQPELGEQFIQYLLSEPAQVYFATETYEYPLISDIDPIEGLIPFDELQPPTIDLGNLDDLEGTLALMREVGVLP
jgi:iron(III) transport system substrate-binding protein